MPGPFPGMDPYLENPLYWRGVHTGLIQYMKEALNQKLLPSNYVADIEERVYVVPPQHSLFPDAMILRRFSEKAASAPRRAGATVLEKEEADPADELTAYPNEIREAYIEIRATDDLSQVVTIIEVLSPSNKALHYEGRESYLKKQEELLCSSTHLLEIDLLRSGAHTVAAPRAYVLEFGPWDYLISLHRCTERYKYIFWRNSVRERLPRVLVPLRPEDPDVILNLQKVFNRCYDAGPYARRVDYRAEAVPPLTREDALWADALLKRKKLR